MSGDHSPSARLSHDAQRVATAAFERTLIDGLAGGPVAVLDFESITSSFTETLTATTAGRRSTPSSIERTPARAESSVHPLLQLRDGRHLHQVSLVIDTPTGRRSVELSSTVDGRHVVVHDRTQAEAARAQLRDDADTDAVTGTRTIRALRRHLDGSLAENSDRPGRVAVLAVHLDGFALLAESLGQTMAETLLLELGTRVAQSTRGGELVARLTSDAFAVVLEPVGDRQDAIAAAERLRRAVNAPITFGHRTFSLTSSIGVAFNSQRTSTAADLLADADEAVRQAKAQGRNDWAVFDDGVRSRAQSRARIERAIDDALTAGLVTPAYQSIVDSRQRSPRVFEALPRVRSVDGTLIQLPGSKGLAEETGRDYAIDRILLDHGAEQLVRLQRVIDERDLRTPSDPLRLAVRVSARTAARPDLYSVVTESLDEHNLPASALVMLLPEQVFLGRSTATCAAFEELLHDGVAIASDDHGSGMLSLGFLADQGITTIRLHPSAVAAIDVRSLERGRVAALVAQAHSFGISVIANGVVRSSQSQALVELGCNFLQGDWIAPPMSAAGAETAVSADS